MKPDIDIYRDPTLIINHDGTVLNSNAAASKIFGDQLNAIPDLLKATPNTPENIAGELVLNGQRYRAIVVDKNDSNTCMIFCATGEQVNWGQMTEERDLSKIENLANVGFWELNLETKSFLWSDEVFTIFGQKRDSFLPGLENVLALFTQEDQEKARDFFNKALEQRIGFQFTGRIQEGTNDIRWIQLRAHVHTSTNNEAIAVGVAQDLTKDIETREQLEKLSLVARRTNNSVMISDKSGAIEWVNQGFERMTGYKLAEVDGRKPLDVLTGPQTDKSTLEDLADAISKHQPVNADLVVYNKGGDAYWVNYVLTPIIQHGELEGFVGIQTDISDRKKADSYIAQAQRMEAIGQLVGGVAHDFNNILGILRGNLELLELKLNQYENKYLGKAFHACDRATGLTKKLLQFSRFKVTESKQINPNKIINNLADLLTKSLTQNVKLELNLAPDIFHVWGSSGDLEDSILNLVINARDAMEGNGKVIISTENVTLGEELSYKLHRVNVNPGEYVRLTIKDTGPGIPEKLLARVFEPFFTTKEQGSGLGLSMVYGFVQRSNGYILIDSSNSPNSSTAIGTEICIWLPRSDFEKTKPTKKNEPIESKIDKPTKIFVVDDEEDILEIVSEYLSPLGCEVSTTSNPVEAQRILLEDKEIDLLITDEVMPGVVKGHTLVKTAIHSNKKIRCIIMSGYNLDLGQIVGKADVLAKPFTRAELVDMINKNLKVAK